MRNYYINDVIFFDFFIVFYFWVGSCIWVGKGGIDKVDGFSVVNYFFFQVGGDIYVGIFFVVFDFFSISYIVIINDFQCVFKEGCVSIVWWNKDGNGFIFCFIFDD